MRNNEREEKDVNPWAFLAVVILVPFGAVAIIVGGVTLLIAWWRP